jgi:hypothetical protein
VSGRHAHRAALHRLVRDIKAGLLDVLVVDRIDRLFRNLELLLKMVKLCRDHQVQLVSVSEDIDFDSPWGNMFLAILGAWAELYVRLLSQETRKSKLARARKGLWNGSIPFGYCAGKCSNCADPNGKDYCPYFGQPDRHSGRVLVPHPIESEAVKLAFHWYATGEFSDADIARQLNDHRLSLADGSVAQFRPKFYPRQNVRQTPGPITKDTVRVWLQRRFYTGMVEYVGADDETDATADTL